jgi:hypothetical protein
MLALMAAARAAEQGPSDARIALIGAVAAAFGTIVGGLITGLVTLRAEGKRQAFSRSLERERRDEERAREGALVRGAARVWRARIFQALLLYNAILDTRRWMRPEVEITPPPPTAEQGMVASAMTADEWWYVQRFESILGSIRAREKSRLQMAGDEEILVAVEDIDARNLAGFSEFAERAIEAIARVAETPEDHGIELTRLEDEESPGESGRAQ